MSDREIKVVWVSILFGVIVSAYLAPKDEFFWTNFSYYWGSQIAVIALLLFVKPRTAVVIASAAIVVPLYLCLFIFALTYFKVDDGSLAFIGYFLSLPGAVIGGVVAKFILRNHFQNRKIIAAGIAAIIILFGLLVNQTIVCNTVMYCPGLTVLKLN